MPADKRYLLYGGLIGAFFLFGGYYLLWVMENSLGWVFLGLAVVNYLRIQRKIRSI